MSKKRKASPVQPSPFAAPGTSKGVRHIGHVPTRLVRVIVRPLANGDVPQAVVTMVVPADLTTRQIIDRAAAQVRKDKGVPPQVALTGSLVAA